MRTERKRAHPVRLTVTVLLLAAACLVGAIGAINLSPRLLLELLGMNQMGALSSLVPPDRPPLTLDGEPLDSVSLLLPPRILEPWPLASADLGEGQPPHNPLLGDASIPGTTRYLLSIGEEGVNALLWELVLPEGPRSDRYRNLVIEIEPGGLIIYADVDLGMRRQRMGLLLRQDGETSTLERAGVVLEGKLYAMPESGSLAHVFLPTGRAAQRTLNALTIVGPLPGEARVEAARLHQDQLQILAQATYPALTLPDTGWRVTESGLELREIDVAAPANGPTERLSIVRLSPADFSIRVLYDPSNPKTVSAWAAESDALLVVNGGYFAPEGEEGVRQTIGLLISDGQPWGRPLGDYAGMLAATTSGEVSVRWLRHRPYHPVEPLTQALQSFPVLVKPGGLIGFAADADDGEPARRTAVAQDVAGNLLFFVAPHGTLSLHELAVFLADSDMALDVALNLDGGGSTGMWLAAEDVQVKIDSFSAVPSAIAVESRWPPRD